MEAENHIQDTVAGLQAVEHLAPVREHMGMGKVDIEQEDNFADKHGEDMPHQPVGSFVGFENMKFVEEVLLRQMVLDYLVERMDLNMVAV